MLGFQLLIHANGQPAKALAPNSKILEFMVGTMMIMMMMIVIVIVIMMIMIMIMMMMIPIVVTLVGIVTDVNPVHPMKALPPNDSSRVSVNDYDNDYCSNSTNSSDTSRNNNSS